MKVKLFLAAVIACSALAMPPLAAFGQEGAPAPPTAPAEHGGDRLAMTPAERAERLATQVTDLTADQKKQIEAIFAASADAMAAIRADGTLSPEQRQAMSRAVQEANRTKIEAVLTEAQRAQWAAARAKPVDAPAGTAQPVDAPAGTAQPVPRAIRRYALVLTDLTDEQKTKMLAVAESARPRQEAVRNDASLTDDQKEAAMDAIRDDLDAQTVLLLTPPQRTKWQAAQDAERRKQMEHELNLRPGETVEQKRARVLKPFEDAVPGLTPAQKELLWPIAEGASDITEEILADDSRTADEKTAILRRINAATAKKVSAVLSKAQFKQWQAAAAKSAPKR